MTQTPAAPYLIKEIQPDWVLEAEAMGSKDKFWFRGDDGPEWLFKFPQPNTGQHWSEKIAAEVADQLDILHARVELAFFQGVRGSGDRRPYSSPGLMKFAWVRGSATESFAREGRELVHGNQILAGQVLGYNPSQRSAIGSHADEHFSSAGTGLRVGGQRQARQGMDGRLSNAGCLDRQH